MRPWPCPLQHDCGASRGKAGDRKRDWKGDKRLGYLLRLFFRLRNVYILLYTFYRGEKYTFITIQGSVMRTGCALRKTMDTGFAGYLYVK